MGGGLHDGAAVAGLAYGGACGVSFVFFFFIGFSFLLFFFFSGLGWGGVGMCVSVGMMEIWAGGRGCGFVRMCASVERGGCVSVWSVGSGEGDVRMLRMLGGGDVGMLGKEGGCE